jgi:hypothetical protein
MSNTEEDLEQQGYTFPTERHRLDARVRSFAVRRKAIPLVASDKEEQQGNSCKRQRTVWPVFNCRSCRQPDPGLISSTALCDECILHASCTEDEINEIRPILNQDSTVSIYGAIKMLERKDEFACSLQFAIDALKTHNAEKEYCIYADRWCDGQRPIHFPPIWHAKHLKTGALNVELFSQFFTKEDDAYEALANHLLAYVQQHTAKFPDVRSKNNKWQKLFVWYPAALEWIPEDLYYDLSAKHQTKRLIEALQSLQGALADRYVRIISVKEIRIQHRKRECNE